MVCLSFPICKAGGEVTAGVEQQGCEAVPPLSNAEMRRYVESELVGLCCGLNNTQSR